MMDVLSHPIAPAPRERPTCSTSPLGPPQQLRLGALKLLAEPMLGLAVGLEPKVAVYWPKSYLFFLHDQMGLARLAAKVPPGYKVRRGQGWQTSDRGTGNYVLRDQTFRRIEADRPSSSVFV